MAKGLRSAIKKEDLARLYLEQKMSLEDIARLYGVSRVAIWKYCRDVRLTRLVPGNGVRFGANRY